MAAPVLLQPEHHWVCPNCTFTDVTHEQNPHSRMHACRGLRGMTAPMVPDGTKCKVELQQREDYLNGDLVQYDSEGKTWTGCITTRDDGQDATVYAPTATATMEDLWS